MTTRNEWRPPQPVDLWELIPTDLAERLAQRGIKTTHDWRPMRWRQRCSLGLTKQEVLKVDTVVCMDAILRIPPSIWGPSSVQAAAVWKRSCCYQPSSSISQRWKQLGCTFTYASGGGRTKAGSWISGRYGPADDVLDGRAAWSLWNQRGATWTD